MIPKVKPWGKRRRVRWRWGDSSGETLDSRLDLGVHIRSEKLIVLHPHLRRKQHHDVRWDTEGHEILHQLFPNWTHARVYAMEREMGQLIHDRMGCRACEKSPPKSGSRRS